jgi:uncharacterized protein YjlB
MESVSKITGPIQHVNIVRHILADDGQFPNNALLPLLVYRKAIHLPSSERSNTVLQLFEDNGWTGGWENGVFDYHHYHSTAHEVLCVIQGTVRLQFGGPGGVSVFLEEGDVVIIPAGVAHKNISGHDDFKCVGAYPDGQRYDINYGRSGERPRADENIKLLPLPQSDPVFGMGGPLIKNWESNPSSVEEVL